MFVKVFKGLCPLDVTGFPLQCLIFLFAKTKCEWGRGGEENRTHILYTV